MAIVVLTVAIIPMVGMFDAALRAATTSGDYDAARACAGRVLERTKSLPYEAVGSGPSEGVCDSSGLRYRVETRFVGRDLRNVAGDEGLTKVTVTVGWNGNSYDAAGVVSRW